MLQSLLPLTVKAFKTSLADFVQAYPNPVFVVDPFSAKEDGGIHTMATDGAVDRTEKNVAWIQKREGANAFGIMVTIGRAQNNDIKIPSPDVSKFHAYVRFDPDGKASLTDAGSKYGTFVQDKKLTPRDEHAALENGTRIRLGKIGMTFHTPEGFHAFLLEPED